MNNHQKTLNDEKIGDDDISSFIENCLTANIKKCFKNVKFNKLPISSLYRIVEKNGQKNSDDLVDFIKKSIQERYILFNFLNTESLSDKKFDELYNDYINSKEKTTIHYYDSIHKDLIYIKKLNEMKIKQKNLQDEIKSLKKENQDLIEKNKYLKIKSKLIKKTYSDEKERDQNNDFNIITKAIMPNYSNWIFLAIACGKGNLKLAQYIVSSGRYSLLENHSMHLQSACSSGNLELVKYIISYNQSNITSRTILKSIIFLLIVFIIIRFLNDISNFFLLLMEFLNLFLFFYGTLLHMACLTPNLDLVKYLVSFNRIDINATNRVLND